MLVLKLLMVVVAVLIIMEEEVVELIFQQGEMEVLGIMVQGQDVLQYLLQEGSVV